MAKPKKITLYLPSDLLEDAQAQTEKGITETIRLALMLLASAKAYEDVLKLRGKVKFSKTYKELKEDRE